MGRSFGRGLFWLGGIFGAIGLLLYLFVYDTWLVPEDDPMFLASVAPTLGPGERILLRRGGIPNRGELARCASPVPGAQYVVGRAMGRGGDVVELENEFVKVNGSWAPNRHGCDRVKLIHPATGGEITLACNVEDNGSWSYQTLSSREHPEGNRQSRVEEGKLFLVSDNRHLHQDSRDFGLVDAATCEHVVFRLWGQTFVDAPRRFSILW